MLVNFPVNNLYSCVQGEGCNTGIPMIMLRLHGCAVGCPWCDTKETWDFNLSNQVILLSQAEGQNPLYTWQDNEYIAMMIKSAYSGFNWVLISGGEPANYMLEPLVTSLHERNYKVAIETSGTELGHVNAGFDWVCVSPKIDMPGKKQVLAAAMNVADEVKMVIGKPDDLVKLDRLLSICNLKPDCQICLQPVSQSPKATKLCISEVQKRGYRLSVQMHKYLAIE